MRLAILVNMRPKVAINGPRRFIYHSSLAVCIPPIELELIQKGDSVLTKMVEVTVRVIGKSADPQVAGEALRVSALNARWRYQQKRGDVRCFSPVRGGLQSTASFTKQAEARFRTQLLM